MAVALLGCLLSGCESLTNTLSEVHDSLVTFSDFLLKQESVDEHQVDVRELEPNQLELPGIY
jgi:hypothetical protein